MRQVSIAALVAAAITATASMAVPLGPAAAQAPSGAALEQSSVFWRDAQTKLQAGDAEGARRVMMEASRIFAEQGEAHMAAGYAQEAANLDMQAGDWQRIAEEFLPRHEELVAGLDSHDPDRADVMLEMLIHAAGAVGDGASRERLARIYLDRVSGRYGENSPYHIGARFQLAFGLLETGDEADAVKALREAFAAAARPELDELVIARYSEAAARLLRSADTLDAADAVIADALVSPAAARNPDKVGDIYLGLGQLRQYQRRFPESVPPLREAVARFTKQFGAESNQVLYSNDKLAQSLFVSGASASATSLAGRNYRLARKMLSPDQPQLGVLRSLYAEMLRNIGASATAATLDEEILEEGIRQFGETDWHVAVDLRNLGRSYLNLGRYDEAREAFERARAIGLAIGEAEAQNTRETEGWLFVTEVESGSRPLDAATAARLKEMFGQAHYPDFLRLRAAKLAADFMQRGGDAQAALALRRQAAGHAAESFDALHPLTFAARLDAATTEIEVDRDGAIVSFRALDRDMLGWMTREIGTAADRSVAEATRALADDMLHAYARLAEEEPRAVAAFSDAAFRWQSMESDERDRLRRIARAIPQDDAPTLQLVRSGIRLSYQAQEVLSASDADDYAQSLTERMARVRSDLDARMSAMPLDPAALDAPMPAPREALADDAAMVRYFVTRKWKLDRQAADPYEESILYAIVERSGTEPKLFNLGSARQPHTIGSEYQIAGLRGASSGAERGALSLANIDHAFTDLHDQLIAPLMPAVGDARTLFIVPDGALYSMPFSLLRDRRGELVEERFTLRLLTRPDALYGIGAEQRMADAGKALLVGGLDYANGAEAGAEPLPGTLREVRDIAALLRENGAKVGLLTGTEASETAVRKEAEGARIVHLATHGSYESERSGGAAGVDTLWQSGIILSRSGDRKTMKRDEEDGRLYAYELMDWDLTGLDLLVLSACETGRGDESFVSGLRGLPTAVAVAGARRSLLTLWPVDDAGTEQFMVRFYEHLIDGKTYPEALRQTRRDAIAGELPGAKDPRVWAAFVMFEN